MSHVNTKKITLEGKTFNTDDIMLKVGCSRSTATQRIKTCNTMDELFSEISTSKKRKFTIEGVVFDVNSVVKKIGCSKSSAYQRLKRAKSIEELLKVSESKNSHNKKMTDIENPINKLLYGKW
jgi:hypothetical protein